MRGSRMHSTFFVLALLLLAGVANAGIVDPPIPFGVCGALDVSDGMLEPGTAFNGEGVSETQCLRLCKKAGSQCRGAVNDVASCLVRTQRQMAGYLVENCAVANEDPADAKLCKQAIKANTRDALENLTQNRANELDSCLDWAQVCRLSCAP